MVVPYVWKVVSIDMLSTWGVWNSCCFTWEVWMHWELLSKSMWNMGTLVPPCLPPKWVGREAQGKRNLYKTALKKPKAGYIPWEKRVAFGGGGPFKFSWKFFSVYSGGYIGVGVIGRCDEQILRGYFPITVFWNLFLTFTRISTVNQQARPNSYPFSCSYSYQNVAS